MKIPKVKELSPDARINIFILLTGAIFAVFFYYALQSFSGLKTEFFQVLSALMSTQEESIGMFSKMLLSLKFLNMILAFSLGLFSFSMFSSGLALKIYNILAARYEYEAIDQVKSLKKAVEWQVYRYSVAFTPLVIFFLVSIILVLTGSALFNIIVALTGFNAGIVSFVSGFIGYNMMFLLSLAVIFTLWYGLNYSFGTEISVSEPDLKNKTIALRSKRIAFNSRGNAFLAVIYALFAVLVVVQLALVNALDVRVFAVAFILNILSFIGLKYLKTSAYINSLIRYYEKVKFSANSG